MTLQVLFLIIQILFKVKFNKSFSCTEWRNSSTEKGICAENVAFLSEQHSQSWDTAIFEFEKNEDDEDAIEDRGDLSVNDFKDDDLGFDPFEETYKALAEDIKIEQKQQQQQQQQQHHHHQQQQQHQHQQKHQYHNNHHNLSHQLHQAQQQHQINHQQHLNHQNHLNHQQVTHSHHQRQHIQQQADAQIHLNSGLKNFLEQYQQPSSNGLAQTRLPPPGFNGISNLNPYGAPQQPQQQQQTTHHQQPPQQQQINKMVPAAFYGTLASNPGVPSQALNSTQINPLVGTARLSVPPGMSGNVIASSNTSSLNNSLVNNMNSGLHTHLPPPNTVLGVESSMGVAPPGLTLGKDDFVLKDIESGLRNMFPSMSSVSTMNTLNTVNTLNSLAGAAPSNTTSPSNPLTNFLNMSRQHQQATHPQESLLQQYSRINFPSFQKGQ